MGLSRRGVRKSIRGQLETLQGQGSTRFSKVQLGDCGDTCQITADADPFQGLAIGLRLRWKSPTDIWYFGAILISIIWGGNSHIFKPKDMKFEDANYEDMAFLKQLCVFGAVPRSYQEIAEDLRPTQLATAIHYIKDNQLKRPFELTADPKLSAQDKKFLLKTMKLDPRDRSTAEDLLQDEWFEEEQVIIIMDAILFALKTIIAFLKSILQERFTHPNRYSKGQGSSRNCLGGFTQSQIKVTHFSPQRISFYYSAHRH